MKRGYLAPGPLRFARGSPSPDVVFRLSGERQGRHPHLLLEMMKQRFFIQTLPDHGSAPRSGAVKRS